MEREQSAGDSAAAWMGVSMIVKDDEAMLFVIRCTLNSSKLCDGADRKKPDPVIGVSFLLILLFYLNTLLLFSGLRQTYILLTPGWRSFYRWLEWDHTRGRFRSFET